MRLLSGRSLLAICLGGVSPIVLSEVKTNRENNTHYLDAIVIRADKTERSWKETASSVVVLSQESVEKANIQTIGDLSVYTPGLDFQPSGQSSFDVPVVRGLSSIPTAFSSSTLLLVDGVPITAAFGFSDSMMDLASAEILRGPQSSLYGRNADGGVIHLYTQEPIFQRTFTGSLGVGERNRKSVEWIANTPVVTEKMALRVAAGWRSQDGFIDNERTHQPEDDRESRQVAAALLGVNQWDGEWTVRYRYNQFSDAGASWGAIQRYPERVTQADNSWNHSQGYQWSLHYRQPLSETMEWVSISGFRDYHDRVAQDTDFSALALSSVERNYHIKTFSQELRLHSAETWGDWLIGAYWDKQELDLGFTATNNGTERQTLVEGFNRSQSLFSQVTLPLSERWSWIVGGRYQEEYWRADFLQDADDSEKWNDFSAVTSLRWDFNENVGTYIRYAEGFRSGGFNFFAPEQYAQSFRPQTVHSWELGFKGHLSHSDFQYEMALYHMDIKNVQVQSLLAPGFAVIVNENEALSEGMEGIVRYQPRLGWNGLASFSANRTEFRPIHNAALDGVRVPYTSPYQGQIEIGYRHSSQFWFRLNVNGSRYQYLDIQQQGTRKGYVKLDASLGYSWKKFDASLFINNALDVKYDSVGILNGLAVAYSNPRTIGTKLKFSL